MSDVEGDQRKPIWLKQTRDLVSQLSLIGAMQGYPNRIAGAHGSFYSFLLWNSLSACASLPVMAHTCKVIFLLPAYSTWTCHKLTSNMSFTAEKL